MKWSEFTAKFKSRYLWGNLLAMAAVVVLLVVGVAIALDRYTHHGEEIRVPDVRGKLFADAERLLTDAGLLMVVTDTGYVRQAAPDAILTLTPEAGTMVKSGHTIYVTINSPHTPTLALPDVIDNSSLREAVARLQAMGFRVGEPERVSGERDWVYGVTVRGRSLAAGDRVSIDDLLTIQVGNGQRSTEDIMEYEQPGESVSGAGEEVDEFEEVP